MTDLEDTPTAAGSSSLEREARPRATWSDRLKCDWISWTVEGDGVLRLDVPAGNCCDMGGAIKTAQALCPSVRRIDTYAGGEPDTTYLERGSEWEAIKACSKARPLTDEQISNCLWEAGWMMAMLPGPARVKLVELIRSVERAHGIEQSGREGFK